MSMPPKPADLKTNAIDFQSYKVPGSVAQDVSYHDEEEGVEVNPGKMLNNAMESLVEVRRISREKRDEILHRQGYGTVSAYKEVLQAGMEIVSDDSAKSHATLQQVHDEILTPLIPIPDEREDVDGLMEIQRMNNATDPETQAIRDTIGNFKEIWIVLRDPATGEVIGAANTAMYSAKGTEAGQHVHGTVNNIYLLVDERYRGLGVSQMLMDARKSAVRDFLQKEYPDVPADQQKYVMFNEQNDPLRMTMKDILFDTCAGDSPSEKMGSKMCQFTRQILFTKAFNNRTLDFPYVQPALGDGEPCATLYYNAFTHGPVDFKDGMPSSVVKQNLKSFFVQSVGKSPDILEDPVWKEQEKILDSKKTINWAAPIDYKAFGQNVYGMIKQTVMGLAHQDKALDEVFGQMELRDLGVTPPLLPQNAHQNTGQTPLARKIAGNDMNRKI